MIDMDEIREKIDDLIHSRPIVFFSILIIVFFFIIGLIVLLIQTSPSSAKQAEKQIMFKPDEEIMIPDAPDVEKDYFPSRTTTGQWSSEELEKWFTYPDEKIMNQLEKSNDKVVDEITGNAP